MRRVTYLDKNSVQEIQIKPKKNFMFYVYFIILLIAIPNILHEAFSFYTTEPGMATIFGAFLPALFIMLAFIYVPLWYFIGKEKLILLPGELHYKKDLLGFGILRKYELDKISNPKIIPYLKRKIYNPFQIFETVYAYGKMFSSYGNLLSFDYGKQTKYFGFNLKEPEAREVLQKIKEYIKKGYINP